MATLISIPVLGGLLILQTTLVSRLPLLHGTADLLLLAVAAWSLHKRVETAWQWSIVAGLLFTVASALPMGAAIAGYLLVTALAMLLRQRIWQAPVLALFVTIFFGTWIIHAISIVSLRLTGNPLDVADALNLVILPSLLLNLLLAVPVYGLIGDLANWLYPEPLEV
jgi:rod shape-determining protein MreD